MIEFHLFDAKKKNALMYKDVFVRLKQRESRYKDLPCQQDWENSR